MLPLYGMCGFGALRRQAVTRPRAKIGKLLKPATIGIVGVSTSRPNFGRMHLDNILAAGFAPQKIRMIKPGMESFVGVPCVEGLASLDC